MNKNSYTPTILIGVGGLGSTIVNDIYAKLHPDMHKQTVVLAMDTDVNWIRSLKNLPENNIIQTSQNQTVGQYIYNKSRSGDESIKEWFQTDILELQRKLMTDGAGQVRGVSRLALRGAIENNEVRKIIAEINRINTQSSEKFITSVRVCLVGSLAGGTGSGIFLQIALMVRKILKEQFQIETVMSIGYFLLGGILEGCGKIIGFEGVDNINANTYACFKELNALTVNASSASAKNLNIEFEYDPNSNNSTLSNKDLPFDYYHVIDHLNIKGKNLARFEDYLTMMVNNVYVYLFSPISAGAFSKMDNEILNIVNSKGQKRVCGSAAGRLVYPYEDVLRLFSLKRTINGISEVWTKFDKEFDIELNEYKRQRNQGNVKAEKPDIRKKYVFYLKNAAENKAKPDSNFVIINNQLKIFDENKEVIGRKTSALFSEIENEIKRRVEDSEKITALLEDNKRPRLKKILIDGAATGQINNAERLIKEIEKATVEFIQNNKILGRSILFDDENKDIKGQKIYSGEKYYLNYWILNEEPMHPIAVRAFIYEVMTDLERSVLNEKNVLNQLKEEYQGLKDKYNDKSKKGLKGTPLDKLKEIKNRPLWKKITSGKKDLKEFGESYIKNFRQRSEKNIEIAQTELRFSIFESLLNALKQQANIIEEFFFSLERILDRFHLEDRELTQKYEYEGGYDINVLSKPEILDLFWKNKENQMVSFDEIPEDLSRTIYHTFYHKFCEKANNENLKVDYSDSFLKTISEEILQNNSDYIIKSKAIDLDIIEGIRMEGRLLGKSADEMDKYLSEKLIDLERLVEAFGPDGTLIDTGRSSFYSMWGVNNSVSKFIPDQLKAELEMQDKTAASFVEDEKFNKREIIRSKILMGQSLDKFFKFYHGDDQKSGGAYYESYVKRIADLQNPEIQSISPHLDKRWHLPNFLPEIFPELNERTKNNVVDTVLKGLLTRSVVIKKVGGVPAWIANHQPLKDAEGQQLSDISINALLDIILQNPQLIPIIKEKFDNSVQKNFREYKKDYLNFELINNAQSITYPDAGVSILDVLLSYFSEYNGSEEEKERGMSLLKRFRKILEDLIKVSNPADAPELHKKKYAELIKNHFISKSEAYQSLASDEMITDQIKSIVL